MVVARNEGARAILQRQFQERSVEKAYLALVDGAPPTPSGRIEASIGRDPSHRKKMAIMPPGKSFELCGQVCVQLNVVTGSFKTLELGAFVVGGKIQNRNLTGKAFCPVLFLGFEVFGPHHRGLPVSKIFILYP